MITRDALTKIFLQQWGKSIDDINVKMFSRKWWQSTRSGKQNNFRLSEEGYEFLVKELDLQEKQLVLMKLVKSPLLLRYLQKYHKNLK